MSKISRAVALTAAATMLAVACAKVPYTDRKQFNAIPNGIMNSMGKSTYDEMLAQTSVQTGTKDAKTLNRVGQRIATVADQPSFEWSFAMIDEPVINAWCLPGGYIGFYNGILPVLNNESGMAFVMGHEVGHAVARHGAERMSQSLGLTGALVVIDLFLSGSGKVSEEQRGTIMGALGVGAQVGVELPFSRAHEKEADVIGMMYMADAGYPPKESLDVWGRMSEVAGEGPPALLSTHPTNEARIANQRDWMPEAKKKYVRNKRSNEDVVSPIW